MVEQLMAALDLKRHQVIKLAIRRFLFPTEISNIPLNGAYAQVTHYGMMLVDDQGKEIDKHHTHEITVTRDKTKDENRAIAIKRGE